jgi:deoxyribose-phosphate aldolase
MNMSAVPNAVALAAAIDHALLQPAQSDEAFDIGCSLACKWQVAALCVKSCDVRRARSRIEHEHSAVAVCAVVGFPHANATTEIICLEAARALDEGATEIDAVVNLARVLSNDWVAVAQQIESFNLTVTKRGGILKVILETGLLTDRGAKVRLCEICRTLGVGYVKTSTGFAMGVRKDGTSGTLGATLDDVHLLAEHASPVCRVKASGGIRSYEEAVAFLQAGAHRIGTASTEQILTEAHNRGRAG